MHIYYGLNEVVELKKPVVAVGSFDGVHLGHCRILQHLHDAAQRMGGHSVVVTFDPHPQAVLHPESDFFIINSLQDNLQRIETQNIDAVVVLPFTKAFSELSYTEFLEQYIIGKLHAAMLVMGPNHAIGCHREGNRRKIEEICAAKGVLVEELPEMLVHEAAVRSANIRKLIQSEDWSRVDEMLGYHYVNPLKK